MEITKIILGPQRLIVPRIGLGCMGMTGFQLIVLTFSAAPAGERDQFVRFHFS